MSARWVRPQSDNRVVSANASKLSLTLLLVKPGGARITHTVIPVALNSRMAGQAEELHDSAAGQPIVADRFQNPPPFEKLVGDLADAYSRRINIQHRLVYRVLEDEHVVKVVRRWTHYE